MQLNIKQMILEGYSYDEITEAVHGNHPALDKSFGKASRSEGYTKDQIALNRSEFAKDLRETRKLRDNYRKEQSNPQLSAEQRDVSRYRANSADNISRNKSSDGDLKDPRTPSVVKNHLNKHVNPEIVAKGNLHPMKTKARFATTQKI